MGWWGYATLVAFAEPRYDSRHNISYTFWNALQHRATAFVKMLACTIFRHIGYTHAFSAGYWFLFCHNTLGKFGRLERGLHRGVDPRTIQKDGAN